MQVTFVRSPGRHDRIYVHRADGSEAAWSFPSYGQGLPHDLVHLLLERRAEMEDGLWGRVARGTDLLAVNQLADKTGGQDKYRSLGADLSGVWCSEALAGVPWGNRDFDDGAILGLIEANLQQFETPAPPWLDLAWVNEARALLAQHRATWQREGKVSVRWTR